MYEHSLAALSAEVGTLLTERLGARGRTLEEKAASVGRNMPRAIREHVAYLIEAEARTKNPKRAAQYDPLRAEEAHKRCLAVLGKIDRRAVRSRRSLAVFTTILVNLFLLAVIAAALWAYFG
jgi:hypothetical protein